MTSPITAPLHARLREVTARITARSADTRRDYLARMHAARTQGPARSQLACTNLAHGFAAAEAADKEQLKTSRWPNIAGACECLK